MIPQKHKKKQIVKFKEPKPKQKKLVILEVNTMLAFLYLAALKCDIPILEKDILFGAQNDSFGYLSEHQLTSDRVPHLTSSHKETLRPINVPFKNKWLRETSALLDQSIQLNFLSPRTGIYQLRINDSQCLLIQERLRHELNLPQIICTMTDLIARDLFKKSKRKQDYFENVPEMLACYLLAFKLKFGLVDEKIVQNANQHFDDKKSSFADYLSQTIPKFEEINHQKCLWRLKDV